MSLYLFALLSVALVRAQAPKDPIADFCRLYGHQTAVIDRKLYIDGGWIYANPITQNTVPTTNRHLFYGDLDVQNEFNFPPVYDNLSKNSSVPDVSGGILWADQVNKVIWQYGGEYPTAAGASDIWGYDVVLNQWNVSSAVDTASSTVQRVAYGAGTTSNDLGRGYYYGGYLNRLATQSWTGSPYATNSLIVFDMDENTITNMTGPPDGIGRAEGVMVSIPASASGVLIYFGGVTYPYNSSTAIPQSMDQIIVYDIADEKWYTQKATGDVPPNRRKFCGGVAWADDRSSYNIYLYGGLGFGENSTGLDDVYILTMPTFQWIKWYPEPGAKTRPHGYATCNVIDNSQMIIMGGNFSGDTDCDATSVFGMHNLNLGQNDPDDTKWYHYLPNVTTYTVPSAIISAVGGSSTGGATKKAPSGGWNDTALQVYFNGRAQYKTRTPTRSLPAATQTSTHNPSSSKPSGAIIGGAVGGAALLLIAALTAFWFCRRKRRRHQQRQPLVVPPGQPKELSAASPRNEKPHPIAHTLGSPGSPESPGPSPYGAAPLGHTNMTPPYGYHQSCLPHDAAHQQYYHPINPQRFSPHQQQYPYNHHPQIYGHTQYQTEGISPPAGWAPHHTHQYFPPPPDSQRLSPPAHEMPTAISPRPNPSIQPTLFTEHERPVYLPPPPMRDVRGGSAITRREVGGSSPTATTRTTSDTGRSM